MMDGRIKSGHDGPDMTPEETHDKSASVRKRPMKKLALIAATLLFALGILGLFALNRNAKVRPSPALWIPVIWIGIAGSRTLSQWFAALHSGIIEHYTADQLLDGNPFDRAFLLALLLMGVVALILRGRKVWTLLRSNAPLVLFFLYCGISTLWSDYTDVSFKIDTFVAGTSIVYPMQWTKTVVPGTHHVEVDLTYEDGRRTSWTGTVVIAGDAQSRLENALRNVTVHQHASRSWLVLVLVGALALVLVGAAIVLRRRGRGGRPVNYQAL